MDFDGYHSSYLDGSSGVMVSYAVIMRCGGYTIDDETATASHELVEAAADPDGDAYVGIDSELSVWGTLSFGTELSDMCQDYASSYYTPSDIGFEIQRSWSNRAAAAGQNPCVPSTASYFNARALVDDEVSWLDGGGPLTGKGVHIAVGETRTIDVELFGSADGGAPWTVSAFEASSTGHLELSWDKSTGVSGDHLNLTIKVKSKNSLYNAEPIWIKSRRAR
ncbi:MAG: hypothetical protein HY075_04055 [Deltaproteobacteria bacterium]|nr:hypothetical protein [Deltaproteobacteria bacterium]